MSTSAISRDDTVIVYGDNNNWSMSAAPTNSRARCWPLRVYPRPASGAGTFRALEMCRG